MTATAQPDNIFAHAPEVTEDYYECHVKGALWQPGYTADGDALITVAELDKLIAQGLLVQSRDEAAVRYFKDHRNWPDLSAVHKITRLERVTRSKRQMHRRDKGSKTTATATYVELVIKEIVP